MHYEVCLKSCPGVPSTSHIGGNDTAGITEARWLEHLEMYKEKSGYPAFGLPDSGAKKCIDKTGSIYALP